MSSELRIELGERSYPIVIGHGNGSAFPGVMLDRFRERSFALVTNTTLAELYGPHIRSWREALGFTEVTIPDGEQYKTVDTWSKVLEALLEAKLDRSAVVIAFGGGVLGDITGFAAATFLRGVDFVQVPTTLTAMVDSSVGGKTGVNHQLGKNLIGAFHQPRLVWIDTAALETLPSREFVSGYAELFKNAFIGGRDMFDFVMDTHDSMFAGERTALTEGIERSVRVKAEVVESDERERGRRALLNFGHTFAHAFERSFGYDKIMHGEAVLWGMACACRLGMLVGTVPAAARPDYERILAKLPLPSLPGPIEPEAAYAAMFGDKKMQGGKLRFVLPAQPGESLVVGHISREAVLEALA